MRITNNIIKNYMNDSILKNQTCYGVIHMQIQVNYRR